ncbi:unnamed protein product [Withania somnifera]
MGRSTLLLALFLMLFFSISHGTGRKMITSVSHGVSNEEKSNETYELDYIDAGPNFNGHGGIPVPSHPPQTPPQH